MNHSEETRIPKFRRFVIQNFPFIEEDFDALTDYGLISKIVEYLNTVIESQNGLIEDMSGIQTAFNTLHDYVEHYFDSLDVQEEINNKLDEMAQEGTLQEIIADYLNSKAVFGFDTVAEMKAGTNLINGSYAQTLGYRAKGDGGAGLYKIRTITNDDVVDEMFILEMTEDNTLIAELITSPVYPETIGAYGDGTHDDYTYINALINAYLNKDINITFDSNKIYGLDTGIYIQPTKKIYLDFNGCKLKALSNIHIFKIRNSGQRNEHRGYIKNLNIDCNNISQNGLTLDGCWRVTFENISIFTIPVGGTGINVGISTTDRNGGNLFTNIRGTGVDESEYTSNDDYNTFINVYERSTDNTFNNVDYSFIKRGLNIDAFATLNNIHGFIASADKMYVGSYFIKFGGSAMLSNAYPDTQQFGVIVANYAVSITNISFVFNSSEVPAETLAAHPAYGVVSTSSAGGKSTNINNAMLQADASVQKLVPEITITENGVSYYKPSGCAFNSVSSQRTNGSYYTNIMKPFGLNNDVTYATLDISATPYNAFGTITFTAGVASISNVAYWYSGFNNFKPQIGLHPVVIESDNDTRISYIRITDDYQIRLYPTIASGEKMHINIPLERTRVAN